MRPATALMGMTDGQREVLERLARVAVAAHREVQRARVLLLATDGVAIHADRRAGRGFTDDGGGLAAAVL